MVGRGQQVQASEVSQKISCSNRTSIHSIPYIRRLCGGGRENLIIVNIIVVASMVTNFGGFNNKSYIYNLKTTFESEAKAKVP